jgi:uncharacterized protein YbjT (DUF2867 family)
VIARGIPVRVLTRDPQRARQRLGGSPDLIRADAQDPRTLDDAVQGVDAVVSAMTGFGPGGAGPADVDYEGNRNLIKAAEVAGVRRFLLLSMHGAAANHPMQLLRMKHHAEEALRASRLDWVILRPNVLMELWAGIIGDPIAKKGKATVFGRGDNPINFNSAKDVARFVELALFDPALSRTVLAVGGPENLSLNQVVAQIGQAANRKAAVRHVPVPLMRLSSLVLGPLKPDLSGLIQAGIAFDTVDMTFDAADLQRRFPQVELTRMADVVSQRFAVSPPARL